jgi:23S rRNA pseudoU1915 N3-methylase RlmH
LKVHLIAVGKKMPEWINTGYAEFSKRMPPELQINLIEITPSTRNKTSGEIQPPFGTLRYLLNCVSDTRSCFGPAG